MDYINTELATGASCSGKIIKTKKLPFTEQIIGQKYIKDSKNKAFIHKRIYRISFFHAKLI